MKEIAIKDLKTSEVFIDFLNENETDDTVNIKISNEDCDIRVRTVEKCFNSKKYPEIEYFHIENHRYDYMLISQEFYNIIAVACVFEEQYYEYFIDSVDKCKDVELYKFISDHVFDKSVEILNNEIKRLETCRIKFEDKPSFTNLTICIVNFIDNYLIKDESSSIEIDNKFLKEFKSLYEFKNDTAADIIIEFVRIMERKHPGSIIHGMCSDLTTHFTIQGFKIRTISN